MESISSRMRKGLNKYWRRRWGYHRLNGSNWGRIRINKKVEVEQLGTTTSTSTTSGNRKRRRFKMSRKIRISRIPSPKKILLWLRDAYVKMMLGLANSKVMTMNASATGYGGTATSMSMGGGVTTRNTLKEYDEKMILHIYKSLMMAQGSQLVPCRDAPRINIASE